MAAFHDSDSTLTGIPQPTHLTGEMVTADFFSTLGVSPEMGRAFRPEEEKAGHEVAILSHRLWQTVFQGDPKIIGRLITLDGRGYTVVGVMPPGFHFPIETPEVELWTTNSVDAEGKTPMTAQRGAHFLQVVARLKPGVSLAQAQADMSRINANLKTQYPRTNTHFGEARVVPELERLVGNVKPALVVLFVAVGLVLLIACVNVANLLLARSMARQKEMAIRAALGASQGRIARQLLVESVVLSLVGGLAGLLLAAWATAGLVRLVPQNIPRMGQMGIDGSVFLFTMLVSVSTGILFGLAPALHSSRSGLVEPLNENGRGLSGGVRHQRLRSALVVAEMGLALALLAGAGLLIRSFSRLEKVNPGFNPQRMLTFTFDLPDARYTTEQQVTFYDQLLRRLDTLPGVRSAAVITPLPLGGNNIDIGFSIVGQPTAPGNGPDSLFRLVSPGYFRTMGIPLIEGREFNAQDTRTSAPVVVVNQAFARKYFPGKDGVGQRVVPGAADHPVKKHPEYEIVGVVGNVLSQNLDEPPQPEYYAPYSQIMFGGYSIVVRADVAPEGLASAVRGVVREMDPDVPVYNMKTMDQYLGNSVAQSRFSMLLLSIFAAMALVLTAIGLYGVISYAVAQRTHEIGIRIALGAGPSEVFGEVLGSGARIALLGVACGTAGALAATRLLRGLLFGVSASDPATFAAVALLLFGVAMLACYIPARRAMSVDPVIALRQE
ncbi:MAG: ABC transporter permease, partial [Acidobacteriota bacterium]|nr:ABC transporter permease [Acidobacteriota bacterium]